jgi:hypothetical protein
LRPFREDEEHLFFGRESQVDTMIDNLARTRFLSVVGTSGSGKSSLVNSGLRPALHRGLMAKAGTSWRIAQFRPGSNPVRGMARALANKGVLFGDYKSEGVSLAEIIEATLNLSKLGLADIYEQAQLDEGVNLLVVVDQFEELFRYRKVKAASANGEQYRSQEAAAFVNLLLEARAHASVPIYLVLTMRSDFLGDCAQFPGLAEAINEGQYLVPRLTRDERKAAITGPVGVGGGRISPVLLTRLLNDGGDNPDQLSILQHALNRTWSRWQFEGRGEGPISLPHYEAIGTMTHALDLHAEKAYADLAHGRQQRICEKIFKALTDATDGRGIRRPTSLATLCALADASQAELIEVIDVFRKPSRSFVMPPLSESLERDAVIDISHESLMRVWGRLKAWAAEEAQSAHRYRRLWETAVEHAANKADLLRNPELQLSLDWREGAKPNAAWASLYGGDFDTVMRFLTDSEREAANARKRARSKAVRTCIGAVLALVAILGLGLFVYTEICKRSGDWAKAYKLDFTQPPPDGPPLAGREEWLKDNFDFQNPESTSEVSPWRIEKNAMVMKPHEWCWLKKVQIASDTKVAIHLRFTDTPEAFQICINAKKKLRRWDNNPPGYSCRFGIWAGAMDLITGNGLDCENDFNSLLSSPINSRGGGDFLLTFTRQGENVTLEVKGKDAQYAHRETFLMPLLGEHDTSGGRSGYFENIGIRTGGKKDSVRVLSVSVSRFKLPEEASPTVAGDALVESGDPKAAIEKYKTIAEDYKEGSNSIHALALLKDYLLTARTSDDESLRKSVDDALEKLAQPDWWPFRNADFDEFRNRLREVEALARWKQGKYREALDRFRDIFQANPETRIVVECLLEEHKSLESIEVKKELLHWIAETRKHTSKLAGLDISSLGMSDADLGVLAAGPSLRGFNCRDNRLERLDSLRRMGELRSLYCERNSIPTLEPIKALQLFALSCGHNRIESLEPVSNMSLQTLYCRGNRIKDLSPLKRQPIYDLDCSHNLLDSLDPLTDLPELAALSCGSNWISSLEPLRGAKKLGYLDCSINEIQTLEPLKDLELYYLDCSGNRLETLDPFVDAKDPPPMFVFDCYTLPDAEIERAIAAWSAKQLSFNVSYGELLLALRHDDFRKITSLATEFGGHRYLFVQKPMIAEEAKQFCAKVDGHLVTITSGDENEFLKNITPPSVSCRIGLIVSNGKPQWVTNERVENFVPALTDFRPSDGIVTWKNGSWLPLPLKGDKPMPFIIEWDKVVTE